MPLAVGAAHGLRGRRGPWGRERRGRIVVVVSERRERRARTGCGGAGGDGADAVQFVPSRMSLGSQARASRTAAATPAATNGGARRVRHASRTLPHRPGPGCRRPPSSLATASSRVTTASGLVTSACLTSPRRGSPRPRASPSARASPRSQVTSVAGGRRLGRGGQRLGALSPLNKNRYRILLQLYRNS